MDDNVSAGLTESRADRLSLNTRYFSSLIFSSNHTLKPHLINTWASKTAPEYLKLFKIDYLDVSAHNVALHRFLGPSSTKWHETIPQVVEACLESSKEQGAPNAVKMLALFTTQIAGETKVPGSAKGLIDGEYKLQMAYRLILTFIAELQEKPNGPCMRIVGGPPLEKWEGEPAQEISGELEGANMSGIDDGISLPNQNREAPTGMERGGTAGASQATNGSQPDDNGSAEEAETAICGRKRNRGTGDDLEGTSAGKKACVGPVGLEETPTLMSLLKKMEEMQVENAEKMKEMQRENAEKMKEMQVENAEKMKELQKENAEKIKEIQVEMEALKVENKKLGDSHCQLTSALGLDNDDVDDLFGEPLPLKARVGNLFKALSEGFQKNAAKDISKSMKGYVDTKFKGQKSMIVHAVAMLLAKTFDTFLHRGGMPSAQELSDFFEEFKNTLEREEDEMKKVLMEDLEASSGARLQVIVLELLKRCGLHVPEAIETEARELEAAGTTGEGGATDDGSTTTEANGKWYEGMRRLLKRADENEANDGFVPPAGGADDNSEGDEDDGPTTRVTTRLMARTTGGDSVAEESTTGR